MKPFALFVLVANLFMMAQAQTGPQSVNYQGRITKPNGAVWPDSPAPQIRVRIYSTLTGGTLVWGSGYKVEQTRNGVFSMPLSGVGEAGSLISLFGPAVFTGGTLYFEVSVKDALNNERILSPRQQIASVPWSLFAQTVSDGAITTPKLADGAVVGAKIADGSVTGPKIALGAVGPSQLTNDYDSQAKVSGGFIVVNSSGQVGMGMQPDANPGFGLTVLKTGLFYGGITVRRSTGYDWHINDLTAVGGNNHDLKFLRYVAGNYAGIPLQIQNSTGNIGIGTSTPATTLDVNGSATVSGGLTVPNISTVNITTPGTLYLQPFNGNGSVQIGAFNAANLNVVGTISGPFVELASSTPGIDFHFGNDAGDYNVRAANDGNGNISFYKNSGGAAANVRGHLVETSSRRWKTNVNPIYNALEKLLGLNGVTYRWDRNHGGTADLGFIAEDVGKIFPELVVYEPNGKDAWGMDYSKLSAVIVEAMREQQGQIAKLTAENEELKRQGKMRDGQMESILSRLERLERKNH